MTNSFNVFSEKFTIFKKSLSRLSLLTERNPGRKDAQKVATTITILSKTKLEMRIINVVRMEHSQQTLNLLKYDSVSSAFGSSVCGSSFYVDYHHVI